MKAKKDKGEEETKLTNPVDLIDGINRFRTA
jgi:hypothetical protein